MSVANERGRRRPVRLPGHDAERSGGDNDSPTRRTVEEMSQDLPWVVFRLQSEHYALSIASVEEMVQLDGVVGLPGAPGYVRGMMTLRGRAIPVTDLRLRLGMDSTDAENRSLIEMLTVREEDHKHWLNELEASVREKRAFELAVDPHQCGFGRWYDTFHTEHTALASVLRRFDAPHKTIHGIAQKVADLAAREAFDDAFALIEQTRAIELDAMVKLFAVARQMIGELRREVGLIMRIDGSLHALAVDAVAGVEPLRLEVDNNGVLDGAVAGLMEGIARRNRGDQLVIVLRAQEIVGGNGAPPADAQAAAHGA